jgi:hypothetical protein
MSNIQEYELDRLIRLTMNFTIASEKYPRQHASLQCAEEYDCTKCELMEYKNLLLRDD